MPLPPPTDTVEARLTLHRVAEDTMAAEQFAAIGKLGLQVTPDGFGTRWFAADGGPERRLRVAGTTLVRESRSGETASTLIDVDADAAAQLTAWWHLGDDVLSALEGRSDVTLWPEHFDIAVVVTLAGGSQANVGFSPGDEFCSRPYLYIGPWEAQTDPFWNAPFGAYREYDDVANGLDPAAFITEALGRLDIS